MAQGKTQKIVDVVHQKDEFSPAERVQAMLRILDSDGERFTKQFNESQAQLKCIEVLSPTTARGTFVFKVAPFYCNSRGNLHGGAQATFFDACTSLILLAIAREDFWMNAGVSRTLTVNYLRPAPEGLEVEMECEIVQAGGSLALLRGVLRRASDGVLLSTCEHTKAAIKEKPRSKF